MKRKGRDNEHINGIPIKIMVKYQETREWPSNRKKNSNKGRGGKWGHYKDGKKQSQLERWSDGYNI